jgi:hypothetical protein
MAVPVVVPAVNPYSIRLPAFLPNNVARWLTLCEFATHGLDKQQLYAAVIRSLPQDVSEQMLDVVCAAQAQAAPNWDALYVEFKDAIQNRYADSDRAALTKLLSTAQRGTKRPSQFLRELQQVVAGRNFNLEAVVKRQFYSSLPVPVQTQLMFSTDTLEQQAITADQLIEVYSATSMANSIATAPTTLSVQAISPAVPVSQSAEIAQLIQLVSSLATTVGDLSKQVAAVSTRQSRSSSPSGYHDRSRSKSHSRAPSQNRSNNGMCWYHNKFGKLAKHCNEPCIYPTRDQAATLNAATAPAASVNNVDTSTLFGQLSAALAVLGPQSGNAHTPQF